MVNWPGFSPVRGRASWAVSWAVAAGLLAEAGDGGPEDSGVPDGVQVQLLGLDLQVRRRGEASVEVEREVFRRLDRAERDRGGPFLDRRDEGVVHVELVQFAVQVFAEGVVAGAGDDGGAAAVAGSGDRHVGRGSAKVLSEGRDILQIHPDVVRVDINTDAPDREQFVGHGDRGPFWCELGTFAQPELRCLGAGVSRATTTTLP